ncbi:hypothetical protein BK138_16180 [Paenibacillus rhizosphaerae]|uniref:Uncharacterized protein n=1 Tax=Paenibacillus rhizosphaerae TaxID=297318 RepID=A0A1R1ES70_9BACL|nr:hypothetical protein [Paenibacillus rhizosphaerae]OMF54694.1 hypothetical protein BK138_16180 [Paenibacillus rhizosphaerae]
MTVKAQTHFVWTEKAEKENPQRSKAGVPIWPHYMYEAPVKWLEDGIIIDSSEFQRSGQLDLFDIL